MSEQQQEGYVLEEQIIDVNVLATTIINNNSSSSSEYSIIQEPLHTTSGTLDIVQQEQIITTTLGSLPSSVGTNCPIIEIQQQEDLEEPRLSRGDDSIFGFSLEPLSSSTPIQSGGIDVYSRRRNVSSPLAIQSSREHEYPTTPNKLYDSNEQTNVMFRVGSPQSPPSSMGPLLIENVPTTPTSIAPSSLTPRSNPSSDETNKQYYITSFIAKYQERIKQQQSIWKDLFLNLRVYVWGGFFVLVLLLTVVLFAFLGVFSFYASSNVERAKGQSMGISGTVTLLNTMHKLKSTLYEYGHNRAISYKEKSDEEQYRTLEMYFNCPRLNTIGVDIVAIYNFSNTLAYLSACHDGKPIIPPTELFNLRITKYSIEEDTIKSGYINVENAIIFVGTSEIHTNSTHMLMISVMKTFGSPYFLLFGRFITLDRIAPISSFTSSCITLFNLKNQTELALLGRSLGTSFGGNYSNVFLQISNEIDVKYQYGSSKVLALDSDVVDINILNTYFRVCEENIDISTLISRGTRLVSYHIIPDFYGEYTVVLRSDIAREYFVTIWSAYFLSVFSSWGLIFVLFMCMIIFIEVFVIRRILGVSKFVKSIIQSSDFTKRLVSKKKDELGELTFNINGMLDVLDLTQKKMEKDNKSIKKLLEKTSIEEQKSRSVMNCLPELIAFIDANDGSIICVNNSFESKVCRKTKASSQNKITHYMKDKILIEDLLSKLNEMSISETKWETCLVSSLTTPIPVIINTTKSKVSNSNGMAVDAFVMVMKIVEQKKDVKSALTRRRRTIDDMKAIEDFENMFNNPTLLSMFRIFLEKEKSVENLSFLEEVRAYKSTISTIERGKKQQEIINKYIEKSSNTNLNISQAVYESEYEKIKNGYGQLDLFDKLEAVVRQMVCADSFKRFSDWSLRPVSGRWSDAANMF